MNAVGTVPSVAAVETALLGTAAGGGIGEEEEAPASATSVLSDTEEPFRLEVAVDAREVAKLASALQQEQT